MIVFLSILNICVILYGAVRVFELAKYPFGYGLFFTLWGLLQYGQFHFLGTSIFYPEWRMGKDEDIILVSCILVLLYLIVFLVIVKYTKRSVFFLKLTGRIRLSTGYFVFCLALLIQSAVTYHIYGTLNLTQTLTKELGVDQVRAIQVGFVVYFASFAYEFLRIGFVYLLLALLSERRIFLAVIISFTATYFLLLSGSKYSFVTIFYFMSTLAFFKLYKPKLYHALALLVLPIILGVLNIFRNTGQLQSISLDSVRYLYKLISWRGDFFHGFYHLIEQITLGNINYYYGVNFFFLPLRIIPRSLFPERPGSSDQILTRQLFGFEEVTGWALNFGGIGDAILAFGIIGVPLAALIAGTIVGMLHRIFIISTNSSHSLLFLFAITNPIWFAPWNVGLNDVIARNFIMWLAAFALMYVIHKIKLR